MKLNEDFEKTITSEAVENWRYPRFFTDNIGEKAVVSGNDAVHISKVLRMRTGDLAVICDSNGSDFLCRITDISSDKVLFDIIGQKSSEGEPDIYVRLFQCVPKSDKMDFIVQKAVELGAAEVIPVISKRCVSRPDEKDAEKKVRRWQRIADEAAKQCGRGRIPVIGSLCSFRQAVQQSQSSDSLGILFYECGGKTLNEIRLSGEKIDIFIGPEGGFDTDEADSASEAGIILTTLGKRILRCETAPVVALSILMNITGNM